MNVTGVDFIAIPTQDFDRAEAFYADVLGLERSKRWGNMPAGEFENGTVTIALMQSDAFGLEFSSHSHPVAALLRASMLCRFRLRCWGGFCCFAGKTS